jgi:hypothetical protein
MNEKTVVIRARCSLILKRAVEDFIHEYNQTHIAQLDEASLVRHAVEEFITSHNILKESPISSTGHAKDSGRKLVEGESEKLIYQIPRRQKRKPSQS